MAWTEDRVEVLTKLWAEGLSASQIAKQLGGVTRNAVIGKVHRLGLSGRATPSRPRKAAKPSTPRAKISTPRAPRTPRKVAIVTPPPPPVEAKRLASGEFATILTITDHMCKWPIGDPSKSDFRFCGRKTEASDPYCQAHSTLAYQPSRRKLGTVKAVTYDSNKRLLK